MQQIDKVFFLVSESLKYEKHTVLTGAKEICMKYRITRHLYAVLTMIILVTGCVPVNVLAEDYTATTVRLLRHEGNIEIKDAKGKKRAVLENVRFNSGETL